MDAGIVGIVGGGRGCEGRERGVAGRGGMEMAGVGMGDSSLKNQKEIDEERLSALKILSMSFCSNIIVWRSAQHCCWLCRQAK